MFGLLSGVLLSARLWGTERFYPATLLFEGLPPIPEVLGQVLFGALLILPAAILLQRSRWTVFVLLALLAALVVWDQSRLQPWVYQYWLMFGALALRRAEDSLDLCRLVVAGTYVWSGLQKANASFLENVFPWLLEPFEAYIPSFAENSILYLAISAPVIEAGIGIALLTRLRNAAVLLALTMHLIILFSVGPLGHNWNSVIWPWNLTMMSLVAVLFWRATGASVGRVLVPRGVYHAAVLALLWSMPLFSFFDVWDSYLSASLYSGNTKSAKIYMSSVAAAKLPQEIREYGLEPGTGALRVLDISDWSVAENNVPAYPERRIYRSVALQICSYAENSSSIRLVIFGKPEIMSGKRQTEIYDCTSLIPAGDRYRP